MTKLETSREVAEAVANHRPIVVLESTVIAHGLPKPLNLQTALDCEKAVRQHGAVPATVGIVGGIPVVGLNADELSSFSEGRAPNGTHIDKTSLNNLGAVIAKQRWAATTVAGSLGIASMAGLSSREQLYPAVFSTGGIGGVHLGVTDSFDVSADLTALARVPMICVCSGAKAILDLPKTLEYLETIGVPVVGYGTREFPAFCSRTSGLPVDATVESPDEVAEIAARHWTTGSRTAVLVCVPVPEGASIPEDVITRAVSEAVKRAETRGVRGKALTPFLLSEMETLTGGDTLAANRALLVNNASVAADIAVSLSKRLFRSDSS